MTRISNSQIAMYSLCSRKFKLHYIDRLRARVESGALVFGRVLDLGLNHLLTTKNLEESLEMFRKCFRWQEINGEGQYLPYSPNIVYSQRDFDHELLKPEDETKYKEFKVKFQISSDLSPKDAMKELADFKKEHGFKEMSDIQKRHYNFLNWTSMLRKGEIMIRDYNKKVMPRISKVLAVQKHISLTNSDGDKITGIIDLIAELTDGKRYILDNKTSGIKYEDDSPMRSQQLILYHHAEKEEYKIDGGVGFIPIYKDINKNRKKVCTKCMFDGSGSRHKTCNNEIDGKRCNAEWVENIFPEANIDVILNQVPEAAENLVLDTFDSANDGIKAGIFNPNLDACVQPWGPCQFTDLCWRGDDSGLIKLGERTKS